MTTIPRQGIENIAGKNRNKSVVRGEGQSNLSNPNISN